MVFEELWFFSSNRAKLNCPSRNRAVAGGEWFLHAELQTFTSNSLKSCGSFQVTVTAVAGG
jgi:hypothetical protein